MLLLAAAAALAWHLENPGDFVGAPDADVDAASAWEITTGDPSIVVAVVDTGVDPMQPDLAAAIYTNAGETPGNGMDDDGNGLVDDVHGWDFADDDPDTLDAFPLTHGTLVAGLIAGQAQGLAPGVTILPIKIFSDSGSDPAFDTVAHDGIEYALARGARVIQIAWELRESPPGPALSTALADAQSAGALIVVAAGNDGTDLDVTPDYPASLGLPDEIVAGATDRYDHPVDLPGLFVSNHGAVVDLAAPGETLTSDYPGGGTFLFSGTSASAPLVSAAAALAWSANPSLSAAQVKAALVAGADRLPALAGWVSSGGRLNAGNAVRLAAGLGSAIPIATLAPVAKGAPEAPLLFDASGSSGATGTFFFADGTVAPDSLAAEHAFSTGGDWPVTVEVEDSAGLTQVARVTVSIPPRFEPRTASIASAHPYPGGTQLVVPIAAPGARWFRLHFTRLETAGADSVFVYDASRTAVLAYQGSFTDLWTPPVRGDSGLVYLRGGAGGAFGIDVDAIGVEATGAANHPPSVAIEGQPYGLRPGDLAALSATASDPDGDPLTLAWTLVDAPAGSAAALTATSGLATSIVPDLAGSYAVSFTASDGRESASKLAWVVTRKGDASGCEVGSHGDGALPYAIVMAVTLLALSLYRRRCA